MDVTLSDVVDTGLYAVLYCLHFFSKIVRRGRFLLAVHLTKHNLFFCYAITASICSILQTYFAPSNEASGARPSRRVFCAFLHDYFTAWALNSATHRTKCAIFFFKLGSANDVIE